MVRSAKRPAVARLSGPAGRGDAGWGDDAIVGGARLLSARLQHARHRIDHLLDERSRHAFADDRDERGRIGLQMQHLELRAELPRELHGRIEHRVAGGGAIRESQDRCVGHSGLSFALAVRSPRERRQCPAGRAGTP
jgi:hypothetical protein